jgi:hypothetical protein
MRLRLVLVALLTVPLPLTGQAPSLLHVRVTLPGADGSPSPVPRHTLLVSDNPATREPWVVLTKADGTAEVRLPPGLYTVESDRPVPWLGKAYQWAQLVEVVAGRDATLDLTAGNAELVEAPPPATTTGAFPERESEALVGKWGESVVAVWSPTSRASGFLVDAQGLIATHRGVAGNATSLAVQLSPTLKVPARVLLAEAARDVAILWIDALVVSAVSPLPLSCPPASAPSLDVGREIVALARPLRGSVGLAWGEVTALHEGTVDTDMRLTFGGDGGPVFDEAGGVAGLTSLEADATGSRPGDVTVVPARLVCEAVQAARAKMSAATPPGAGRLPVEPAQPYPTDALQGPEPGGPGAAAPTLLSSSDFEVALITPPMVYRAQQRAEWTGGRSGRSPEAEARLGRLTDFGAWSGYFADNPAVLVVRVTPKLVEGFWKRLAREAARTQGAELPAFKDFTASFLRLRASCGGVEVAPIHPFVLEHRVSPKTLVREGLYVFDPQAFGAQCGSVTLSMYSEKAPEKVDTLAVDQKVLQQIRQDFAAYRP